MEAAPAREDVVTEKAADIASQLAEDDSPEEASTPFLLVDQDILDANLRKMQDFCDRHKIGFRAHAKTHKTVEIANRQLARGAIGLACQRLDEAEALGDDACDIMVCVPVFGEARLMAASALARRVNLSVMIDSETVARSLSESLARHGGDLSIWIECDSGLGRTGLQEVAGVVSLAKTVASLPKVRIRGIATYPTPQINTWFDDAVDALKQLDICEQVEVSVGGTPEVNLAPQLPYVTELRAGTYALMDLATVDAGCASLADCALTVEATCISRPTATRAVIDAGSKAIGLEQTDVGADLAYGVLKDRSTVIVTTLAEEHGILKSRDTGLLPAIGERVSVITSHCCYTVNLHDVLWATGRNGAPTAPWRIANSNRTN